jgi:hypothetical protein
MANEVAKTSATANFFEKYGQAATAGSFLGQLLTLNKFDEFTYGRDKAKLAHGTVMGVYMNSLTMSRDLWLDGRLAESIGGLVCEGFVPPRRGDLSYADPASWPKNDDDEKPRDVWQLTNRVVMVDRKSGELFTFTTSSDGGRKGIGELCKVYGKHCRQAPNEMPIIELDSGRYQHSNPRYGEIPYPIFPVIGWIPMEELPPIDGAPTGGEPPTDKGQPALALPEPTPKATAAPAGVAKKTAAAPTQPRF